MIRLIIAGSRSFSDYEFAKKMLDSMFYDRMPEMVISGCARGADEIGQRWAKQKRVQVQRYAAQWRTYGKSAGMIRNEEMAKASTHLVAFWDGESPGTKNMIERARKHGVNVTVIGV